MSNKKQGKPQAEMSFLDHLEVLRWHLIRATAAVLVFTIVAFFYKSFFLPAI
jgi:sec-independent protein translocase protein TatC